MPELESVVLSMGNLIIQKQMNSKAKMKYLYSCFALLLFVGSTAIYAANPFSLNIDANNQLIIKEFGGNAIAVLPLSTVTQPVVVGGARFLMSYGMDANNLPTAVISPVADHPSDLQFNVINKAVQADHQAVVTMTFSHQGRDVAVEPFPGVDVKDKDINLPRELMGESQTKPSGSTTVLKEVVVVADHSNQSRGASPEVASTPQEVSTHFVPFTTWSNEPVTEGRPAEWTPPQKKVTFYWSEPVTSPEGNAPSVGLNEMKLCEIQGSVFMTLPDGSSKVAQNDMIMPSGATLWTESNSSAALLMGGVNSIRLLPLTQATVNQNLEGQIRNTLITISDGTVFSRVGRRDNETQNFRVCTTQGIATATGTEFADTVANHRHYLYVVRGSVDFASSDEHTMVIATPETIGNGALPSKDLLRDETNFVLFNMLNKLQPFNQKLPAVLDHIRLQTATEKEIAFYNDLKRIIYDPSEDYEQYRGYPVLLGAAQNFEPFGTQPLTPY